MPEQLTKHPEVTLQVLRSAGAQCGEGAPQAILTQCPPARFCKLPGGEVCVYGLPDAPHMTQLSATDWQAVQQALRPAAPPSRDALGAQDLALGAGALLVGLVLGVLVARRGREGAYKE
jgi:uncharacterized protein YneF (UPF0154 family)